MKHTSLFSAVAIAAAMSTSAFATVSTNNTHTVDFEGQETVIGNLTGWTAQTGDMSSIIAAPLSEGSAVEGYTANKHLELNTEGTELTWVPDTYSEPKAIIEMQVRLVAADQAPTISETDVHAAVCLVVDESTPANDGLYAYTATGWQKLDTSAFNTDLVTGSMVALRVLMDYTARTATYEGALLADAENDVPNYVNLGTKDMANANDAEQQGHLASISFKGTGGVDDLFVGEIEETPSTANVTLQLKTGGEWVDTEDGTVDTADSTKGFESVVSVPAGKVAVVTVCDDEYDTLATLSNVIDQFGQLVVTCEDYAFVAGEDYYIRVEFVDPAPTTYLVTFVSDGSTYATTNVVAGDPIVAPLAPTKASDATNTYAFDAWYTDDQFGTAYVFGTPVNSAFTLYANFTATPIPVVTGVEFGTFAIVDDGTTEPEFTAFSVSGTTATATLKAKIVSTGDTATQKKLYAKYTTALGSTIYSYVEATVTAQTTGDEGAVTVSFTLPAGDSAFFVGFTNENE